MRANLPKWWVWELVLTSHVELRMEERDFTEIDLRRMLERASTVEPARAEGRFEVVTRHGGRKWSVILEPDLGERLLFLVTAFPTDEP